MSGLSWGLPEVIAAGCGPVVKVWAPTEPQQAIKLNEGTPVYAVDFSHNNRVLAVGGDKGQASLYSGKGASVQTGAPGVGSIPRTPDDSADAITCIKFAPSDSSLVMGCKNGLVHVWGLKDVEGGSTAEQLNGSVTSVAVNSVAVSQKATTIAASSSSGQVVLNHFPNCRKARTLQKSGVRTGCLGFYGEHLLCGARDSGQLVVWDVTNPGQHPEELNVHRRAVTGCMFSPNDSNLLVSCGADGQLVCTDRRLQQVVWESKLHQPLSSLTMRWDGIMLAVGTIRGRVLVHDTRRISSILSTQEFTDELPVTALCWQNEPHSKAHKRNSLGTASAAAAAADTAADSSASAAPSTHGGSRSAAAAAAAAAAARGGSGASAGAAQHKAALVVPNPNSTPLSQVTASSSSEQEYGMRVISPVRMFSPQDSDTNSAAAADGPGGAMHTPDAVVGGVQTPADSAASGPGYKGPVMFTPGLAYMGAQGFGGVTPFGDLAADITPVSRLADPAVAAAPTEPTRKAAAAAAVNSSAGLPVSSKWPERMQRGSAGGANTALPASKGTGHGISCTAAAAAGRGSRASGGGSAHNASDAPMGPSSHKLKPSDSTSVSAAAGGCKSHPSSAAADSRNVQDTAGAAADGSVVVTAKGVGASAGVGKHVAGNGGTAVASQQQISSSSNGQTAAAHTGKAAASNTTALGVTSASLREDVFKAYVDKRMNALEDAINGLRSDMNKRLEQAQEEIAMVASSLAARQDQLAEAITQLTAAVQSLSVGRQEQHEQHIMYPVSGVTMIPWI